MHKYKVVLKNGMVVDAECKYLNVLTIHSLLNEYPPFVIIGEKVFAKSEIVMIEQTEITEE